jgi:head-tail adaptor
VSREFAGTLSERIVIERAVADRDALGLKQEGWAQLCRCLASVVLQTVGPEAEAQALSAMPRYRVTVRRRDGIALDQRVTWRERRMMIRQLIEDPRLKDRIAMMCEEVRQ